jgi:NodT family efflux transporter outer membrane factor (OMF) lipoprotein
MPDGFVGVGLGGQAGALSTASPAAADVSAWWSTLGDDRLTRLIGIALVESPDIEAALARVRQARAARRVAGAEAAPSIDAIGSADRSRSRADGGGRTGNFFRAGFDATWEIDVFGGIARGVEAADEGLRSAIEDGRDVQISLAAEVASVYVEVRSLQRRLMIARRNLALQRDTAGLTRERFEAGFVGTLDVANAEAQAASTAARIPALESDLRVAGYALGVLVGREPVALLEELAGEEPIPAPPPQVPVGLPSDLLLRRPDIRRAEADLAAQNARVGVAVADLFPRFSLSGSFGMQGDEPASLGTLAQRYWSIGPSVRWNVLDGGRVRGAIELEEARLDERLADYRRTVLVALRDVETALARFSAEQSRRVELIRAVDANRTALDVATELYTGGETDFLNVLSAQGRLLDSEDALSQSEQAITTQLIALYKALGGGWAEPDFLPPGR